MTIFKTAYDTQACQGFVMHQVESGLEKAQIMGLLSNEHYAFRSVVGNGAAELAIPGFGHPYLFREGKPFPELVVDMRPFGKFDELQQKFQVKNIIDHKIAVARGQLNNAWLGTHGNEVLRDTTTLPLWLYCEWVAGSVARRFALDKREEQDLAILAGWFYLSNFTDEQTLTDRDRNRMVQTIARTIKAPAEHIFSLTDELQTIASLSMFCSAIQPVSIRLKDCTIGVLIQLLSRAWFGTNAPEMLATSLEHPPTWYALILAAATDRTFKTTTLAKMLEKKSPAELKQFVNQIVHLLAQQNYIEGPATLAAG